MTLTLCPRTHPWEMDTSLVAYGEWYHCPRCYALGRKEGEEIVTARCVDCGDPAVTLWKKEADASHVPVCEYHVNGVIIL